MDFDEYEYLEKTVENPEPQKLQETVNGGDEQVKSEDKYRRLSSRHRGEDDADLDRKSKRSRTEDDARGRDRNREKSSSRHRSRSREGERSEKDGERHKSSREHRDRDRNKEKEERNGRDRDQEKEKDGERDRDRDSGRKDSHRDKEGEKDRDERDRRSRSHADRRRDDNEKSRVRELREKSRDREHREKSRDREHREKSRDRERREKSRDREKSRGREHREKSRDREHREKSRDRELREKSRDRELRDRESRRHKEKKDETTEPEADPERDQRTVFAYQLPLRADERDIFEFFSKAGKVRDVRLIMDRNSRRSKGVGYIEFYDVMSVPMAIAMSGQLIRGQPVMVKPSEAEKNLVQSTSTAAGGATLTGTGAARKLYVGNLVPNITEEQIRVVFDSFGIIELVQLPRDETGLCKGFAFVQFARLEDAKSALTLNGLEIGGRNIKVSAVTDYPGWQEAGATTGDLDDDEGGGLALNASSRALLMQKLDRSGIAPSVAGSLASSAVNAGGFSGPMLGSAPVASPMLGGMPAGLSIPPVALPAVGIIGVPSECLLLKNMFDPNTETEPDFDLDIKDDVKDECVKFGELKHIFVDKLSEGHVYLKFEDTQSAMNAQQSLHGRWFAGKMITATFMLPQNYEEKFPESR